MQSFSPKSATERPPCPKCVRDVSNSIQNCPHFGVLMRQLGDAITEGEVAYIRENEEFD